MQKGNQIWYRLLRELMHCVQSTGYTLIRLIGFESFSFIELVYLRAFQEFTLYGFYAVRILWLASFPIARGISHWGT